MTRLSVRYWRNESDLEDHEMTKQERIDADRARNARRKLAKQAFKGNSRESVREARRLRRTTGGAFGAMNPVNVNRALVGTTRVQWADESTADEIPSVES